MFNCCHLVKRIPSFGSLRLYAMLRKLPCAYLKGGCLKSTLFAFLLSLVVLPLTVAAESLSFENFSQTLQLQPTESGGNRYFSGDNELRSGDRIILKVAKVLEKEDVLALDVAMTGITELYRLKESVYYSANISESASLSQVIATLADKKGVHLVQPDLLQLKGRHHGNHAPRPPIDHIQLLGIAEMWQKGKGEHVKVAIIDDGFALDHEDLKNTRVAFQYDMQSQSRDASPKLDADSHGTQVAGIIFAQHNEVGGNGVAPNAELIAIRDTETWTSNLLLGFNLAKLAGADVINCSWTSQLLLEPVVDVINDLAQNGRDGKGVAVVFSAGNGRSELQAYSSEATLPNVISVGSKNLKGQIARFSNHGEHIQYYTYGQRILTTSTSPDHQYKNFGGTSASAPIVSGLVALMLSADNRLTLAQIKKNLHNLLGKVG